MDAGAKPSQVSMQRASRNITSVQIHVTNTRLGRGRPKKKRKFSEEVIHGQRKTKFLRIIFFKKEFFAW
jgi:hypothetical protein